MENSKIHICYLADAGSIHTFKFANYFQNKGYKVSVISFTSGQVKGVQTYFIDSGILSGSKLKYFIGLPKLKRILAKLKPDLVHAIYLTSYGFMGAATKYHPLVISAIGSDVIIRASRLSPFKFFVKYAIGRTDLIHSQSKDIEQRLIKIGAPKDKILTFTYGINSDIFKPRKDFVKKGKTVISTRKLNPIYNIKLLINSIPFVLEKIPDIKFLVVGDGIQEVELKELVKKLKIEHAVIFLGVLTNDEVVEHLNNSDVYVSTSLSDGQSISLLEAMAAGTFPVVTDIEANKEWIGNGKNGFLCSVSNPEDLANKIIRALLDDNLRKRVADKNIAMIKEKGSYQKNMKLLEEHYLKLIDID